MNAWKVATVAVAVVAVLLLLLVVQLYIQLWHVNGIVNDYAAGELTRQAYVPGKWERPDIADAPAGTRKLLRAEGRVSYPATTTDGAVGVPSEPPTSSDPTTADRPTLAPTVRPDCDLGTLSFDISCGLDVVEAGDRPWGRLAVWGEVQGYGQTRQLQRLPAGRVDLQVARSVKTPTWHLDVLGGVSAGQDLGAELGAAWAGRSRVGGYALYEWRSGGDRQIHGGVKIRLK